MSDEAEELLKKGYKLMEDYQYAEAEVDLRKCAELAPESPDVLYYLGMCLNFQGKFKDAIPILQKAIALNPKDRRYLRTLRTAYVSIGDDDSEYEIAQKLLELLPEDADAWSAISSAYINKGRFQESVDAADKAIRFNPNLFMPYFHKSIALYTQKRFDDA